MSDYIFRKSTYSDPNNECVEVATNIPGAVAVRDSKVGAPGPLVRTSPRAWRVLLSALDGDVRAMG
ncbi:DUF397 domain-containing protein [Streptomyces sp. NPDC127098]|uniref:DUF397 domain-containing protein n=1 Tax=Streptomyces sp. NPDC127098 TaxID=3347137 RepID=UPI00364C200D